MALAVGASANSCGCNTICLWPAPGGCTIAAISTTSCRAAVLLIRDERSRAVCSLLLRQQGYHVLECDTIESALLSIRTSVAEVILVDLPPRERLELQREIIVRKSRVTVLLVHERPSFPLFGDSGGSGSGDAFVSRN
jgi:hypothetical protein